MNGEEKVSPVRTFPKGFPCRWIWFRMQSIPRLIFVPTYFFCAFWLSPPLIPVYTVCPPLWTNLQACLFPLNRGSGGSIKSPSVGYRERMPRHRSKECPNAAHTDTTLSQCRQRVHQPRSPGRGRRRTCRCTNFGTQNNNRDREAQWEKRQEVKSIYVVPCQRRTTASDFKPFNLQASWFYSICLGLWREEDDDDAGNRVAPVLCGD